MKVGDLVKFSSKRDINRARFFNIGLPISQYRTPEKGGIGVLIEYDKVLQKMTILCNDDIVKIDSIYVEEAKIVEQKSKTI